MEQKINIRLSFIALLAVVFVTAANLLVFYNLFRTQITSDLKMNARLLMETEIFQREYDSLGNDPEKLSSSTMNKLKTGDVRLTWIAEDGTVLFDNDAGASGLANHLDRPEIQEAMASGEGESIRSSQTLGMDTYYYALRLENGTVLRVSTQAHAIAGVFFRSLPIVAVVALLIFGICIVLGHALSRQIIQPIEKMAEEIDKPTSEPPYKELEPFAEKIRSQHENLLEAVKTRQDFTANVSHELKTPLAVIRANTELEMMMHGEDEWNESTMNQVDRMTGLISNLVLIAKADEKANKEGRSDVDVSDAVAKAAEAFAPVAKQNGKTLTKDIPGEIHMVASESQIQQLVTLFVDNAIKYCDDGGEIKVTLHQKGKGVKIAVSNNYAEGKDVDYTRFLDRFYREDQSHNIDKGGFGIGLSIADSIVRQYRGKLDVSYQDGVIEFSAVLKP